MLIIYKGGALLHLDNKTPKNSQQINKWHFYLKPKIQIVLFARADGLENMHLFQRKGGLWCFASFLLIYKKKLQLFLASNKIKGDANISHFLCY